MKRAQFCLFPFFVFGLAAAENHFDAQGRLERIELGAGWLNVDAQVKIAVGGWTKMHTLDPKRMEYAEKDGKKNWLGRAGDGESVDIEIVQSVSETAEGLSFEIKAGALKSSPMDALVYWIDVPSEFFANGSFDASGRDGTTGKLPPELPSNHILASGMVDSVRFNNADKTLSLMAKFGAPVNVTIQDGRRWGKNFSLLVHLHNGTLERGQAATLSMVLKATGNPDQSPAEFKIDAAAPRYKVLGIGGNYCFNLDTPEKEYTLAQLKPQFARTEISLHAWQPRRGAPPTPTAGKLPLEFELMRELARKKIPFIASIWQAPEWMCRKLETTENGRPISFTALRPEAWTELVDSIGAYLLFAKTNYQAEPDYFSFNEPDYGAKIRMFPDEHRDLIKRVGAHLEKLGLKTRCLLGDVSNPRVSFDYLQPAMNDPQAMKYVGALSFHSWNGASPERYAAWADLAQRLKLPLIVAEVGVDPEAWKSGAYKTFDYGLREMSMYQELFLHARPQAILYWEYTADYSLMASDQFPKEKRGETERFALQKHWVNFVPPGSEGLAVSGGKDAVLLTAFRKARVNEAHDYTLHLSNTAWPRKVRVKGIPPEVKTLQLIETARGVLFQSKAPITPINGTVELELPARSLTTLTTLTR